MSLAAFLKVKGHNVVRMAWEEDSCYFLFSETDALLDDVYDFVADEARVNPREYNMTFGSLKKAMFSSRPHTAA